MEKEIKKGLQNLATLFISLKNVQFFSKKSGQINYLNSCKSNVLTPSTVILP